MKTKTIKTLQSAIVLIIIILVNLPLCIVAAFGYWAYNKVEFKNDPELFSRLRIVNSNRIKSDDPEVLRNHAQKIWSCLEATEEERLNHLQALQSLCSAVSGLILLQFILFTIYYYLTKKTE